LLEKYTSKKGLFTKKPSARDVDAAPPSPSPPGGPVRTPSSGSLLTNSGGAPQPNSNPDYVSSALLQGNYNAVNAVTYSQLQPDAAGGGPPGLGAAPAPPGLGAPPAVPSKGGPPPGAPARTPSTTNAAPAAAAAAAAAAAKPVEYKSLADVKKVAPVVYDAKLGDLAGKTEEKAPVTYESSMEAMKRGAPTPVVYDAKLETDGISAEDLAALDAMAAGLSDDDDNDPPRAPDDIEEPVAASPPTAAAVAAGGPPAIAKPRGALPLPTRGAPPSVPARGAASPIAKPRGPLPTPAARGASPQPGIAKPRGPLPTPGRAAAAPTPAAGLAMPALPAAAVAGGIVLEPLSDDESD
jgi:translation initiation factor IF-2